MKTKITQDLFLVSFLFPDILKSQVEPLLYKFEDGLVQSDTYAMAWSGLFYSTDFKSIAQPLASSIYAALKILRIQKSSHPIWKDNQVGSTFTPPVTNPSANSYFHIIHQRLETDGGVSVVDINEQHVK